MPLIFTCPPAPISCWEYISNKHSTRMNDVYKCTLVPSGNSSLPTTCRPDTVTMSSGPARCSDSISVIGITIFPNIRRRDVWKIRAPPRLVIARSPSFSTPLSLLKIRAPFNTFHSLDVSPWLGASISTAYFPASGGTLDQKFFVLWGCYPVCEIMILIIATIHRTHLWRKPHLTPRFLENTCSTPHIPQSWRFPLGSVLSSPVWWLRPCWSKVLCPPGL